MTFEIGAEGVDVEKIMRGIRERIEEKKKGLYTEEEIREIAERRLESVLEARDLRADLIQDFRAEPSRWNFSFETETIYRSSRGLVGRALEAVRRLLRPVQKLFWNPNPMIDALSRQSDLNKYYVHLFHNLALELTRLNLEVQELKNRNLQLQGRLELLVRREKTLESMVAYREDAAREGRRLLMRLAFVVQRYGLDIAGGAEYHCRLIAEHLGRHAQVTVLTTCARDYVTWANHYPAGEETLNGVPVRRFPVDAPRDPERFALMTARLFGEEARVVPGQVDATTASSASQDDALKWLDEQGPRSPPARRASAPSRKRIRLRAVLFLPLLDDVARRPRDSRPRRPRSYRGG